MNRRLLVITKAIERYTEKMIKVETVTPTIVRYLRSRFLVISFIRMLSLKRTARSWVRVLRRMACFMRGVLK